MIKRFFVPNIIVCILLAIIIFCFYMFYTSTNGGFTGSKNDVEEIVDDVQTNEKDLISHDTEPFVDDEITHDVNISANRAESIIIEKESHICLAKNIYYESRNQSEEGQYAVAFVVMNRVQMARYPDNICDVVYQKWWNSKKRQFVPQFSWTKCYQCRNPKDKKQWQKAKSIAESIMQNYGTDSIVDPTKGSTHYHATYVKPKWRTKYEKIIKIGDHIFYRMKKSKEVAYFMKNNVDNEDIK